MKLLEIIPRGEQNAIHTKELSRRMLTNDRAIIREIHEERCKGNIICSSKKGYYLPDGINEVHAWYKSARKRALSTLSCLKTARKMLKDAGIDPDA